jgi:5'-nucleotidase (lipoprotein e(P4) family)
MKFLLAGLLSFCCVVAIAQSADSIPKSTSNMKLLPVLWQQHSAEYRALCYQAFNIAGENISKLKKKKRKELPYAIITDIDETVLDNSYHEADRIIEGTEFTSKSWKAWTEKSQATPVPGAIEFMQLARKKGVAIFYISNRDTTEIKSTIANLQRLNFPNADRDHMLFLSTTSSKEERRQKVLENHRVVMLLGDNLNDFTQLFEKKNAIDRKSETDKVKELWGTKFIVLPNAIYGEWENALYDYKRGLTPVRREELLRGKLIRSSN